MQISRAGEYGVLGLLHLVRQPGGQPVMIDAVSRDETIPKSFLAKIFQDLAKAGLLRSQRGAGGGFVLARTPEQITVLEVIEAIDGPIALQRCLGDEPECDRKEGCALCLLFNQAQDRLKEVFARTSLADLARKQATMGSQLPVAEPSPVRSNGHTNGARFPGLTSSGADPGGSEAGSRDSAWGENLVPPARATEPDSPGRPCRTAAQAPASEAAPFPSTPGSTVALHEVNRT